MKFHFIYLAAGYSRRFGTNKLLAPYNGTPMYRVLLNRLVRILETDELVKDITVVTQYREIEDEVNQIGRKTGLPVRCVINPDPSRGISSSIKCAVKYLMEANTASQPVDSHKNDSDRALIFFVADTPHLAEETVLRFIHTFAQSGKRLACIGRDGEMGNPGGFGAEFIPELMELEGDRGGKRILLAHKDDVFIFSDTKPEELEDIDYSC
jgi:molybdenum cofactor cytidylyltransferase